jgi:hypothetical protein
MLILFLAVEPGMDLLTSQGGAEPTCCDHHCAPTAGKGNAQDQNQDNDFTGKSCNPFQICTCCALVCLNIAGEHLPNPTAYSGNEFSHQSTFISRFGSDFWHPPKIV